MRLTGILKRLLTPARGQGGFSIAEVMIAGAVLTLVTLPMMQMFGTTYRITNLTEDLNKVQVCVRHFTEQTRAVPFYEPYVTSEGDRDMDDLYWGDGRGIANNWNTAPEVLVKAYDVNPYPQFRVTCKMVYLNDDTSEATMRNNWGPKIANRDDPVDSVNRTINMIKFQIKAYWKVDGVETSTSNHSLVSIMTRSQVQANLGVSDCVVEAAKRGTTANSAPHIYNTVNITITGFGFKPGCTASLLHPFGDIAVKGLTFVDQGTLTGYVDLASDGAAGYPWSPRAIPGGWSVKVLVGTAFAVLNDGLVAEFPKPALTGLNPLSAGNLSTNELVTVTGNPILSLAAAGGYNNCKAVLQLVWRNADGSEDASRTIYAIAGTTTVSGDNYGAGSDQVAARFNLSDGSTFGAYPQNYYAKVWNCKDSTRVGELGDVSTSTASINTYLTVAEAAPEVYQVYQTGSPARNWGFSSRSYNLTIKGKYFDSAGVTVYVGRGGTPPDSPSVQGTSVTVVDSETITANFNLASAMPGNEGWCWAYVRNNASGRSGSGSNLYEVRKAPNTSGISNTDGKGYKYNYYDIAVTLSGQDFYSGYQVYYQNTSGGTVYQMGVNDGEGAPVWSSSNTMTGYLNLIGVPNGTYRIWVADPYESTTISGNATFTSAYGAPVLLASGSPYNPTSVWIKFKYRIRVIIWWGWSSNITRYESGATRAWAPNGENNRQTRVDFQVQGMGFLDSSTGSSTNLNISNNGLNGNFTAAIDRAGKTVYLRTTYWNDVNTSSSWLLATAGPAAYNLALTNNNGSGSTSYTNRWETKDEEP